MAGGTSSHVRVSELSEQLEAFIDRSRPLLTSGGPFAHRQAAAGALIRCRNLLQGVRTLLDGQADLSGLLIRNLAEAFVVGTLLLYDPAQTDLLLADHARNARYIAERNGLDVGGVLDDWPESDRFRLEQGMAAAAKALQANGEEGDLGTLYDLLYRAESTWGVHGIGLATPYVTGGSPMTLVARPVSPNFMAKPWTSLLSPVIYVVILVRHVFRAFGIDASEAECVGEAVAQLHQDALSGEDEGH